MCGVAEGLAAASLVMGGMESMNATAAAQQQAAQQNAYAQANAERANAAAVNDYNALQKRLVQEGEARTEARIEQARAGREATGQALAATGSAGVSGLSVNALLADYARVTAGNKAKIDRNYDMTVSQIEQEKQSVRARAEDRIASVPQASAPGLNIAGLAKSAFGAFETFDKFDSKRPKGQARAPWNN